MGTSSPTVTPGPLGGTSGQEPTLARGWVDAAGHTASDSSGAGGFLHWFSIPGSFCLRKALVGILHFQNSLGSPEVLERVAYRGLERV